MIKYVCNRCGKEIASGDFHSNLKIRPNIINDRIISFGHIPDEYEIDLCPDCLAVFDNFLKNKVAILPEPINLPTTPKKSGF